MFRIAFPTPLGTDELIRVLRCVCRAWTAALHPLAALIGTDRVVTTLNVDGIHVLPKLSATNMTATLADVFNATNPRNPMYLAAYKRLYADDTADRLWDELIDGSRGVIWAGSRQRPRMKGTPGRIVDYMRGCTSPVLWGAMWRSLEYCCSRKGISETDLRGLERCPVICQHLPSAAAAIALDTDRPGGLRATIYTVVGSPYLVGSPPPRVACGVSSGSLFVAPLAPSLAPDCAPSAILRDAYQCLSIIETNATLRVLYPGMDGIAACAQVIAGHVLMSLSGCDRRAGLLSVLKHSSGETPV